MINFKELKKKNKYLSQCDYIIFINNKVMEIYSFETDKKAVYQLYGNWKERLELIDDILFNYIDYKKIIIIGDPIIFFKETATNKISIYDNYCDNYIMIKKYQNLKDEYGSYKFIKRDFIERYRHKTQFIDFFSILEYFSEKENQKEFFYAIQKNKEENQLILLNNSHYTKVNGLMELKQVTNKRKLNIISYEDEKYDEIKKVGNVVDSEYLYYIVENVFNNEHLTREILNRQNKLKKVYKTKSKSFVVQIALITLIFLLLIELVNINLGEKNILDKTRELIYNSKVLETGIAAVPREKNLKLDEKITSIEVRYFEKLKYLSISENEVRATYTNISITDSAILIKNKYDKLRIDIEGGHSGETEKNLR